MVRVVLQAQLVPRELLVRLVLAVVAMAMALVVLQALGMLGLDALVLGVLGLLVLAWVPVTLVIRVPRARHSVLAWTRVSSVTVMLRLCAARPLWAGMPALVAAL
jgi:hypothetical protein